MKKIIVIICVLLLVILFIPISNVIYNVRLNNLESTDLSNISINEISLSSYLNDEDLSKYEDGKTSDKYDYDRHKYDYLSDSVELSVDENNRVNNIFSPVGDASLDIKLSINDSTKTKTLYDIESILGNNYITKTEDRSQGLEKIIFNDRENKTMAEFIYDSSKKQLVWVRLYNY